MTEIERIRDAEKQTKRDPTEKEKSAGNYPKGKLYLKGLKISIENPKGSIRSGRDGDGKEWSIKMTYPYGYINGTIGTDDEPIDIYIGEHLDDFDVFVVDQINPKTGKFDEHKVMFGFVGEKAAIEAYLSNYTEGWKGMGNIVKMSLYEFKEWVFNHSLTQYPAKKKDSLKSIAPIKKSQEKIAFVKIVGDVVENQTLENLKDQAGNINNFESLVCEIASSGGSVSEGLKIMMWFDFLSSLGKTVTTVVSANAYSVASLIALAANNRLISKYGKIMIHNPIIPELRYANADTLEKHALTLRKLEESLYEIYEIFTKLDRATIKVLMDVETYILPDEAVKLGFADAVINIEPKPYMKAINNFKQDVNMSKTINILNKVIGLVNGSEIISQFYYDKKGGEIEIYQQKASTYSLGDKTSMKVGEVSLADGSILVIEDFVISDIKKADPEKPEAKADPEKPEAKADPEKPEAKADPEKPEAKADPEKPEAKADPEKPEAKADPEKPEAKADPEKPEAKADPENVLITVLKEQLFQLKKETVDLKKEIEKIKNEAQEYKKEITSFKKFEETATEAIDVLAKNTVSLFKPSPKDVPEKAEGGSIFQRLKKERNL